MTDPGRIDLRVLDHPSESERAERIVRSALTRARRGVGVLSWITARAGPIAVAAGALLAAGVLLWRIAPTALPPEPLNAMAQWIGAERTLTNGEILAAFQGYRR